MFRPFTKEDWYGMAGASKFENGSEPLVNYDITVDGMEAYAVLDGTGFALEVLSPDGDVISAFYHQLAGETATFDGGKAIAVARFLAAGRDAWDTGDLWDIGLVLESANVVLS
jgi:hypothetical protein